MLFKDNSFKKKSDFAVIHLAYYRIMLTRLKIFVFFSFFGFIILLIDNYVILFLIVLALAESPR
jgi:hypothetical protein